MKWGQKVYRHKLGTPTEQDKLVYEEQEEGFSVGLRVTLSDRFLLIESGDFSTSDVRVLDLAYPEVDESKLKELAAAKKKLLSK